ncbi:MAG: YiiD C-terminal domain-containing protein [Pseudomonadota bacterium]
MRTPDELTRYLHEQIPLTRAMGLATDRVSATHVSLKLPLAANHNHKGTMFGGSLAALGTLACWALIHVRMERDGLAGELVVMRSEMDYTAAVTADCFGICSFEDEDRWGRCRRGLERRGRSKLAITSELETGGLRVAQFAGDFAIVV